MAITTAPTTTSVALARSTTLMRRVATVASGVMVRNIRLRLMSAIFNIAATTTTFSSSMRPWLSVNKETMSPCKRSVCMTPDATIAITAYFA